LRLSGEHGTPPDYEAMRAEERDRTRLSVIDRIVAGHEEEAILRGSPDRRDLAGGASFVLDATTRTASSASSSTALKKVPALPPGRLPLHPMLFCGGRQVRKEQKILLELQAQFLSGSRRQARQRDRLARTGCKPTKYPGAERRQGEKLLQN